FSDGPMAEKTFEHAFAADGTVTFHMADGKAGAAKAQGSGDGAAAKSAIHYEVAPVTDDVYAVSYLSKGYTLTTILDFKTKKLVAFSSNEKNVSVQHGTLE
ncbi:MAG TPA: MoaF N-terminal domain-containing protein, partial [Polyangiaceae bacterium]